MYNIGAFEERGDIMNESTVQLDVKEQLALHKDKSKPKKTERELALVKYAGFLKSNLARLEDITDPNYVALEVVNDEGLTVSSVLKEEGEFSNFKICHAALLDTLLENPIQLSKINLIHAVMPFDDVYPIVQAFSKIPEVTGAKTRVILGTYDNYEDAEHKFNLRVLNNLMSSLDFSGYHGADIDGISVKMVYSTYQKNLRMRH